MSRSTLRTAFLGCLIAALATGGLQPIHGLKMQAQILSSDATVEVAGIPRAQAEPAIQEAFAALRRAESDLSLKSEESASGGIARLQEAAGSGEKVPITPLLQQFLSRTLDFCLWSDGAHGPLGAPLYDFRARRRVNSPGTPNPKLTTILELVDCRRLAIDRDAGVAELAADTRFNLRGFDLGYAVDRGIEALSANGVTNGVVRVGGVIRAIGSGPNGRGWPVDLPLFPGLTEPLSTIYLHDQSAAFIAQKSLGEPSSIQVQLWLNQRTGSVTQGVVGVVVITDMALDAQGLATTSFILGEHDGRLRLGVIRPQPAILWLLGSGQGEPLLSTHHWSKPVFVN